MTATAAGAGEDWDDEYPSTFAAASELSALSSS